MLATPLLLLLAACTGSDEPETPAPPVDGKPAPREGCRSKPPAADRGRVVLASRPYDAANNPSPRWGIFDLSAAGVLTDRGASVAMGRATYGRATFTPDGQVGLVPQEDGSLGVFTLGADGAVSVVHPAFKGSFYAVSAAMDPSGERAWIVDPNWPENGGGLYEVRIGCADGALTGGERVLAAKSASHLLVLPGGKRGVLIAAEVEGQAAGQEAHLLDLSGEDPVRLASAAAFADDDALVSDAILAPDGRYALVADNSLFSGRPNRIGAVEIRGDTLATAAPLSPVTDPVSLLPSPHGDAIVAISGYDNALLRLAYSPGGAPPLAAAGEPAYAGAEPALPAAGAILARGPLAGLAVITENQGIRLVSVEAGGAVTDRGLAASGSGSEWILGAVALPP